MLGYYQAKLDHWREAFQNHINALQFANAKRRRPYPAAAVFPSIDPSRKLLRHRRMHFLHRVAHVLTSFLERVELGLAGQAVSIGRISAMVLSMIAWVFCIASLWIAIICGRA